MSENGAKFQKQFNMWLKENWLMLVTLAIVIGWGVRIEGRTDDRYTATQAEVEKAALMLIIKDELIPLREDITDIKEDVAYLRGQHSQESDE